MAENVRRFGSNELDAARALSALARLPSGEKGQMTKEHPIREGPDRRLLLKAASGGGIVARRRPRRLRGGPVSALPERNFVARIDSHIG